VQAASVPFASLRDAQVYRKGLRIGTDVLAEDQGTSKERFLLLPGDSIFIPRNQSFVEVSGAVFNPQIVDYTSTRFMYYISSAGGITDNAKLKRAYILYTNGINRKTKHFLFFRTYPKVKPGSKIIVPEKSLLDLKPKIGVGEISAATAILTALVTLFTVIKK
jgi:protein involved in polysaccharide export with SLBB domain